MYVGSISGTTTAYWSKINGASEIPDNVKYLSQTYVTEDPTTLWSELESMTNSGSVSAGDFFPFRFNANTVSTPTANAGHGFYQYGTNCAYAIIFEEVASGNGRAWFGHFESNDGAVEWTQIGSSGSSGPTDAITITDFKSPGATAVALKQGQVLSSMHLVGLIGLQVTVLLYLDMFSVTLQMLRLHFGIWLMGMVEILMLKEDYG